MSDWLLAGLVAAVLTGCAVLASHQDRVVAWEHRTRAAWRERRR